MRRVIRIVQDQRDARYGLLRGYFHGADDDSVDELQQERLASFTLPLAGKLNGKPLSHMAFHALDIQVLSLRRKSGKTANPADDPPLEEGDTLVLRGKAEALAVIEQKLLRS
jgi:CPA2 family monovalent cation:H+ antiporter-2